MLDCGIPVDTVSLFLSLHRKWLFLAVSLATTGLVFYYFLYSIAWLLTGFPCCYSGVLPYFFCGWVAFSWVVNRNGRPITTTDLN